MQIDCFCEIDNDCDTTCNDMGTCQLICSTDVIEVSCLCGTGFCGIGRFCVDNANCYTEADSTACNAESDCGDDKNCFYEEDNSHCVANKSDVDCNTSTNCSSGQFCLANTCETCAEGAAGMDIKVCNCSDKPNCEVCTAV